MVAQVFVGITSANLLTIRTYFFFNITFNIHYIIVMQKKKKKEEEEEDRRREGRKKSLMKIRDIKKIF